MRFRLLSLGPLLLCVSVCLYGVHAAAALNLSQSPEPMVVDGLGKGSVPLDGPWQFHLGDNPSWASATLDDSEWEPLAANESWGLQTHPNYDGYAWYRRHLSLSPAPGATPHFDLLIPAIDDVYEVYWNGSLIGQLGHMPPHLVDYHRTPAQVFHLDPDPRGVLAVRVFKLPFGSNDDGTAGGFSTVPTVGSPRAIAALRDVLEFHWLRGMQFRFALSSLYGLVAVLGFFAWYRDRTQKILFWTALYAAMLFLETPIVFFRLPISFNWLDFLRLIETGNREVSLWFLLLLLLRLDDSPHVARTVRSIAIWVYAMNAIDAALWPLYPVWISARTMTIADAVLTVAYLPLSLIPPIIVILALRQRRRIDSARWVVATFALLNSLFYLAINLTSQGSRFTHWTISDTIDLPIFAIYGSPVNVRLMLRTFLFFAIVWAVIRYAMEKSRRQSAIELEIQSVRELQQILIPEDNPELPGYSVASIYKPASEVGGDFFQIIPFADPSTGTLIVLGDVSGKGLKAAMAVSLIVGTLRTLAESTANPAEILAGLNRRLHGRLHDGFATCLAMRLTAQGQCTLANAGQIPPYRNGKEIPCESSLPLGIVAGAEYCESELQLASGDSLTLISDGVLEARSKTGELYGFDRAAAISTQSAQVIAETAQQWGQEDDITVLRILRTAEVAEAALT